MIDLERYVRRLPKAELHLHLEGVITPALLLRLAQKYDTEYARLTEEELEARVFEFGDFEEFLTSFRLVCGHLREPEDYVALLEHLAGYFRDENIRYAEILYTPSIPWRFSHDGEAILSALLERSRDLGRAGGFRLRWILDCVRQFGAEWAWRTARLAGRYQDRGVVAVGLGGDERVLAMSEYEEVFAWSRANQLFSYIHAGEIGGPEQVWDAVRLLGANRIAHGIQAARDGELMLYLREHAICLDVCLTSNLLTGAWAPVSENPFRLLYKRGVPVTLNTDDPGLFRTALSKEILKAVDSFDLGQDDVRRIVLQGVHASFLDHSEKMVMMQEFQDEIFRMSAPES